MKLTAEYIEKYNLTSLYNVQSNPDFTLVHNSITNYDEGYVGELYIYKSNEDSTLWGFYTNTNSWDDSDYVDDENIEVFPVTATPITVCEFRDESGQHLAFAK